MAAIVAREFSRATANADAGHQRIDERTGVQLHTQRGRVVPIFRAIPETEVQTTQGANQIECRQTQ
jgi:hypothetical protein